MTQLFDEDGRVIPATIISTLPNTVIQLKTETTDGYDAVQIGFGAQKENRFGRQALGHFKKSGKGPFRFVREFKTPETQNYNVGDTFTASDFFKVGDKIEVSGISKGKGFQGVVKRHNFAGGSRTHGQKHSEREAGAIGGGGRAGGRVFKGMRMAGRMGSDRVTIKNLKVLHVDPKDNLLVVSGAVPGRRGTLVEVKSKE